MGRRAPYLCHQARDRDEQRRPAASFMGRGVVICQKESPSVGSVIICW
jgi:hypothetical protein